MKEIRAEKVDYRNEDDRMFYQVIELEDKPKEFQNG